MTSPVQASDVSGLHQPSSGGFRFRHIALLALAAFVFVLFFYRLGSYPLFDLDEPRYAEAAREMMVRGNWITPYFNDELRFDKPIFFYWLIMLAYHWFGLSEFAARFFSAVSAAAIVGMVYAFGRTCVSVRYGFFAALILASSLMFTGLARMSITDMTLTCLMTGATLCLFLAAQRDLRWWLAAGVFAGLAILTKGPVGIVLPGAIFTIYTLLTGQFRRCLLNRWLPLALLLALAIALPWYWLAYLENGPIFLDALVFHNVNRFADVVSGHQQPVWFYAVVLSVGFLPWTATLPAAIRQFWRDAKNHRAQMVNGGKGYLVSLYAVVWMVFTFVFFTISHTKLLTYILPLFPALALLTAMGWQAESKRLLDFNVRISRWFAWPAWVLVIAGLIGGLVFMTHMDKLLPREAAGVTANEFNLLAVIALLAGLALTAWLLQTKRIAPALLAQASTIMVVGVIALHGIVPNVSRAAQGVMLGYLRQAKGQPLALFEIQRPSLTFYGQRRIPRLTGRDDDRAAFLSELHQNPQTLIITKDKHVKALAGLLPAGWTLKVLDQDDSYRLLSVSGPLSKAQP